MWHSHGCSVDTCHLPEHFYRLVTFQRSGRMAAVHSPVLPLGQQLALQTAKGSLSFSLSRRNALIPFFFLMGTDGTCGRQVESKETSFHPKLSSLSVSLTLDALSTQLSKGFGSTKTTLRLSGKSITKTSLLRLAQFFMSKW